MTISKTLSTLSLAGALVAAAVALSPSEASAAGKKSQPFRKSNASQIGLGGGNGGASQRGFGGGNGGASQRGLGGGNGGRNIIGVGKGGAGNSVG